jgi:3-hydroxyisobutyrate dehydrogenase-like beta-hydroxyacid dehydrogenase
VVDLSSSRPLVTQQTAAELARMGLAFLDAPVSGGVARAREGDLAIMVGGEPAVVERVRPVLEVIGRHVMHVGAVGAGHTAKAINNLISAATLAISAEGIILGARAGLDPAVLVGVINKSSGRSNSTELKFPRYVLNRRFDAGFSIGLMFKDLGIGQDLADQLHVPMMASSAVRQLWGYAMAHGGADDDHTAIVRYLEELAGVTLGKAE